MMLKIRLKIEINYRKQKKKLFLKVSFSLELILNLGNFRINMTIIIKLVYQQLIFLTTNRKFTKQ